MSQAYRCARFDGRSNFRRISILAVAAALAAMRGSAMAQFQLGGDGQGVSFSQEDIQFETGPVDDSDSAGLTIDYSQLSTSSGISGGGYLNVVNADGWTVENLEVTGNTSTYLDLNGSDGTDETGVGTSQSVFYSATPLTLQPVGGATHFGLTADNISPGGVADDPGAANFIAPAAFTGPTPTGANNLKIQAGHPNIDAAVNQCAPAAAANGITYLAGAFNFVAAGASNVEGRGQITGGTYPNNGTVKVATFDGNGGEQDAVEPGDSMVGEMDLAMGRTSQDRKTIKQVGAQINNPTPFLNQLSGIQKFLSINGGDAGKVKVNYEGAGSGANNVFSGAGTVAGIPANAVNGGNIDATTPAYILAEIAAGNMVNLDYAVVKRVLTQQGITYKAQYGHAVDIIGTATIKGVPQILTSSDLDQTNTDLPDDSLGKDDGQFWASMNAANFQNSPYLYLSNMPGVDNKTYFAYVTAVITVDAVPEPVSCGVLALSAVMLMRRRSLKKTA